MTRQDFFYLTLTLDGYDLFSMYSFIITDKVRGKGQEGIQWWLFIIDGRCTVTGP